MLSLIAHATKLGVTVRSTSLTFPMLGFYDYERRVVYFDHSLSPNRRRNVVAHELGHVRHAHRCGNDSAAEQLADEYAARLLIAPDEYARAERLSLDPERLADELGVTPRIVRAWMRLCLRGAIDLTIYREHVA